VPIYDPQRLRRTQTKGGRLKGAWIYVPQAEIAKLRGAPESAPPLYKVTGLRNGRTVRVEFFDEI
jgi:hypothetical protein